jgi:single-strand DNA-binding protein
MASLNQVSLIGNLTRDPELRFTPKGTATAQLGIAVNRKWRNDAGEQLEEVTFIDVDVWGKAAEAVGKYLSKGAPVFIGGRLKLDQWDDKQTGQKRTKLKVVAENVQFLGRGERDPESQEQEPSPAKRQTAAPAPAPAPASAPPVAGNYAPPPVEDDNIPF